MYDINNDMMNGKIQPRIMIIDDSVENIALLERILNFHGYQNIKSISDSRNVMDEFKAWQPDIILLDLLMPHFDGLDILDQINCIKDKDYLPVIMITADNDEENRLRALRTGANDYIAKPFNAKELIARIENLIKLKASMDQALATETAFLQAQIKPHFLYNTLNTISSFCDTNPEKASKLIDEFSKYLRQSFDLKSLKFFVPVERELQLIYSFVEIQKARFGERISFELTPAENMDFKLPPLCLQPLVENSIRHGLKKYSRISVWVKFENTENGVYITVKDDGPGIPEEKKEHILTRSENKGIGLWNIDARLKKFYGAGLHISSDAGCGTNISFNIPLEVWDENCDYSG